MERKEKENKGMVRLGLIYSVEHHRFDVVYKEPGTSRIRIGLSDDQEVEKEPINAPET